MSRRRFNDSVPSSGNNDYADNTKYDEKYIMPTDAVTPDFGTSSVYAAPAQEPGRTQSFRDPMAEPDRMQPSARPSLYAAPRTEQQNTGYGASQPTQRSEAPMVFALRSDPTLFVYEFSDRLEYYRNTPTGMMLCNVEYKKNR